MLEDAAEELFLEQTYEKTTVQQITLRAGVSRGTFFNYFSAKSDLLWIDADDAITALAAELAGDASVTEALGRVAASVGGDRVPLAVTQADLMGTRDELVASGLARVARLSSLLHAGIVRGGEPGGDAFRARIAAQALTGAVVAAWGAWAASGVGRGPLAGYVDEAVTVVAEGLPELR